MTPTAWDFRNKLLAILSAAKHSGKPYVDVESGNLFAELGGDPKSNLRVPICTDIMTKMMRPGDLILQDNPDGDRATMLIRYILTTTLGQQLQSFWSKNFASQLSANMIRQAAMVLYTRCVTGRQHRRVPNSRHASRQLLRLLRE